MDDELLAQVRGFLGRLETLQSELDAVFQEKYAALIAGQAGELDRLVARETGLTDGLQKLLEQRSRILDDARHRGFQAETLADLVDAAGGDGTAGLRGRIGRARQMTDRLRRTGWGHWIAAHRVCCHYSELMDLVAHAGQRSPTYGTEPGDGGSGGAILDASI